MYELTFRDKDDDTLTIESRRGLTLFSVNGVGVHLDRDDVETLIRFLVDLPHTPEDTPTPDECGNTARIGPLPVVFTCHAPKDHDGPHTGGGATWPDAWEATKTDDPF